MRNKGSKDKKKRKVKNFLNSANEGYLIQDYEKGEYVSTLVKKYNVTRSYISSLFKKRGVRKRLFTNVISEWEKVVNLDLLDDKICGIYALYFLWNSSNYHKINDIKVYIGSSINIKKRLKAHLWALKNKRHESKKLSSYFDDQNFTMHLAIIERCDEKDVLQRENFYLNNYSASCLLNMWRSTSGETLKPWLEKAIKSKAYAENYIINETTGCKESLNVNSDGYGACKIMLDGGDVTKYFYKHRVAYWEKHGEYPELIRHKCNNRKCYNADHLEKGNYRDNNLDKRGSFPQEFESKWVECCGNPMELTTYFGWKGNCIYMGQMIISNAVYEWEKKLGLRDKYPNILDSSSIRRFSINNREKKKRKKLKGLS